MLNISYSSQLLIILLKIIHIFKDPTQGLTNKHSGATKNIFEYPPLLQYKEVLKLLF